MLDNQHTHAQHDETLEKAQFIHSDMKVTLLTFPFLLFASFIHKNGLYLDSDSDSDSDSITMRPGGNAQATETKIRFVCQAIGKPTE